MKLYSRPFASFLSTCFITVLSCSLSRAIFFAFSAYKLITPGTDACFDEWCATTPEPEQPENPENENQNSNSTGQYMVPHVRMTNQAREIAQQSVRFRAKSHSLWVIAYINRHDTSNKPIFNNAMV